MALEIKVNDTVTIVDGLPEAMAEIKRVVETWVAGEQEEPLVITIHKNESRGPPSLSIHVQDKMDIKTLLR